jgi:hypothetical protein
MRELRPRASAHEQRDVRRARRPAADAGHSATPFDQRATGVATHCSVYRGAMAQARTGRTMVAPMREASCVRRSEMTPGGMPTRDN